LAPEGLTGRVVNRGGVHPSDLQSPFSTVPATTWPEELVSRWVLTTPTSGSAPASPVGSASPRSRPWPARASTAPHPDNGVSTMGW